MILKTELKQYMPSDELIFGLMNELSFQSWAHLDVENLHS